MAAPSQFRLPLAIGALWRDIFAWWVLVCGKDGSGNPQPIAVGTDGKLAVTVAAGTAAIGKVGIDQTTPGTTNGVQLVGSQRAIVVAALTASTVAAGHKSIALLFSSDFVGTVGGTAFSGTADTTNGVPSVTFNAPPGDTLSSIVLTKSAGTGVIVTIG